MKMVATSLLSEGKVWEGVELLILTGKVGDPCSYLKSAGHWDQALWLGKCRMEEEEYSVLAGRWEVQRGHLQEATLTLTLISVGSALQALECLHVGQLREIAFKMLPLLVLFANKFS